MDLGIINTSYAPVYAERRCCARELIGWNLEILKWADRFCLPETSAARHIAGVEPKATAHA